DPATAVPYLITANHCIEDQQTASTVEVWWDYGTGACGGGAPDPETLPASYGATLLATGERGDFTLLQLPNAPGARWFLGWDRRPEAVAEGALLHRISHPKGWPQSYSSSQVGGTGFMCDAWPRSQSIYQTQLSGLIAGGSSGSPVLSEDALLLGQASGLCGSNASQACNLENALVDGAFRSYWPEVAPWLAPGCTYAVQAPTDGSQWPRGGEMEIRWSSDGYTCAGQVKLRLLRNGERVGVISPGTPDTGRYVWSIPPGRLADSTYAIELVDARDETLKARSEGQFSIVERLGSPQCRYQLLAPGEAEVLTRGQAFTVHWTSDGANCGDDLRLRLLRDGQRVGVIARLTEDDGEYAWQVPPGRAPGATYRIRLVSAVDDARRATSAKFQIVKP
ncbi:MAG: Ser-Thr-rich GPI-anchored membrane family protein, partial [Anaerolineae bacterium]